MILLIIGALLSMVVWIIVRRVNKRNARLKAELYNFTKDVDRFNESAVKEIVQYNGKYFIRQTRRQVVGGYHYDPFTYIPPKIKEYYRYVDVLGGITVTEVNRWNGDPRKAILFDSIEEAKAGLETLSIKYINPEQGEVVYREEPKESVDKDLILELIKAVENQDKEKEIEILHALGHSTR
jgi:hypothetical protein